MISYLNHLPVEIYPNIAVHLPLYLTPSTLISLALVNHRLSEIVIPLVYSRLILKNESDALKVIKRLLNKPELGKAVREIHILSDLSSSTRVGTNPFDVISGLEILIATSSLPYIHTLGLHLLTGWYHYVTQDSQFRRVFGFGRLQSNFGKILRKNCPRLRGLVLRNIADDYDVPWVDDSGLLEMQDITSLTLFFTPFTLTQAGYEKLLENIGRLSANLHSLDIAPNCSEFIPAFPFLSLTFPRLRSLGLASFALENSVQAMAFWIRHPKLEFLKIANPDDHTPWFVRDSVLPQNFLPNLKHLKAPFCDVRTLSPILSQLVSLTVYSTINAQVPYLLRVVLPDGLPHLKSLNIGQTPSNSRKNANIEGALWYERENGIFCEAKVTKARRTVLNSYIPSIALGAPNLEEIGFHSNAIKLKGFANIASEIASLSKLRRFYFEGLDEFEDYDLEAMVSSARILAEACSGLSMIVDTSRINLPYVVVSILRTESGEVSSVDLGSGFGMQIGSEDEAFPG